MKITSWNARGLNSPGKKRILKQHLTNFNSDIILLQETKLSLDEGSKLAKSLGLWQVVFLEARGASGGLGIIWNPKKVDVFSMEHNYNWMSVIVHSLKSDLKCILFNIYAPVSHSRKKVVWDEVNKDKSEFFFINTKLSLEN